MSQVLMDSYSVLSFAQDIYRGHPLTSDTWHAVENLILCEKIILDRRGFKNQHLGWLGEVFPGVFDFVDLDWGGYDWQVISPTDFMEEYHRKQLREAEPTTGFLLRAKGYLKAAQRLDVYLSLHPSRSQYLRSALGIDPEVPAAAQFVRRVDARLAATDASALAGIDFRVPAVVDHVVTRARQSRNTIVDTIVGIRESRHALRFRKWASEVDAVLRSSSTRSKLGTAQRALREVDRATGEWVNDLDAGVRYRVRKLSLRRVWGLGALLEASGLSDIELKDPILVPSKTHMLFLNDLYRT